MLFVVLFSPGWFSKAQSELTPTELKEGGSQFIWHWPADADSNRGLGCALIPRRVVTDPSAPHAAPVYKPPVYSCSLWPPVYSLQATVTDPSAPHAVA